MQEKNTIKLADEELKQINGGEEVQPGWTVIDDTGKYCSSFYATQDARECGLQMCCYNCTHRKSYKLEYCDLGKIPNIVP